MEVRGSDLMVILLLVWTLPESSGDFKPVFCFACLVSPGLGLLEDKILTSSSKMRDQILKTKARR